MIEQMYLKFNYVYIHTLIGETRLVVTRVGFSQSLAVEFLCISKQFINHFIYRDKNFVLRYTIYMIFINVSTT